MAKPAPFPHNYTVKLEDRRLAAPPRAPIAVGAPLQFGGSDEVWGPEELLVGAALECLWTTFDAYARHDGLRVEGFSGTGVAVLDKGKPVPVFTSITLSITLAVPPGSEERARSLLATAGQHCIVSNALKVPVTLDVTMSAHAA
jgi:organic hydroperoxide reductase OsmC/OhrA